MIELRQPLIQGNEKEQLAQIKSYLIQFRDELQYAFNSMDGATSSGGGSSVAGGYSGRGVSGGGASGSTSGANEESAVEIFNSIKGLIINNADFVEKFSEKIALTPPLVDKFVGKSEYGTFTGEIQLQVEATGSGLTVNSQKIEDIENVYSQEGKFALVKKSNGYIKIGYFGNEEYGIEIGYDQGTGKTVGKFTSAEVALYTPTGEKGAWLAQDSLHANKVEFTSMIVGCFIDEYNEETDSIITRWVGKTEANNGI